MITIHVPLFRMRHKILRHGMPACLNKQSFHPPLLRIMMQVNEHGTACLSDWFQFMIRMLRHYSRGACYSEAPSSTGAWRDRGTTGRLAINVFHWGTSFAPEKLRVLI
ncbi:hypothetical protein CEXT_251731 [Caerostris extrusa]|uniref:Uncharacterized protein n=1 Tax=Caerostris extrusa TaxID=172846 RepID=A0AAV4QV72_CAEEX|nr:hypothetical protein CEXT_251731 [Caerostris extrusa]